MEFEPTPLDGVWLVRPSVFPDERGEVIQTFDQDRFRSRGLCHEFVQANFSNNTLKGTLRGMHWQEPPRAQAKLVRCIAGSVWDVIVDLRPKSKTLFVHFVVELTAENQTALYIPQGFAHGYQTLEDHSTVSYQTSDFYDPHKLRGFRHDDPRTGIAWPLPVTRMVERDREWPPLGACP